MIFFMLHVRKIHVYLFVSEPPMFLNGKCVNVAAITSRFRHASSICGCDPSAIMNIGP